MEDAIVSLAVVVSDAYTLYPLQQTTIWLQNLLERNEFRCNIIPATKQWPFYLYYYQYIII